MQELPGLNPDRFGESKVFLEKKIKHRIKIQAFNDFITNG